MPRERSRQNLDDSLSRLQAARQNASEQYANNGLPLPRDFKLSEPSEEELKAAEIHEQSPQEQYGPPADNPLTTPQQGSGLKREQGIRTRFQYRDAQKILDAAGNVIQSGRGRLEGIPMPGGIVTPLIVLFVFFLLLLPVKGADGTIHTRFTWFWLGLTGNAHVTNGGAGGSQPTVLPSTTNVQSIEGSTAPVVSTTAVIPQAFTPSPQEDFLQ